MKGSEIRAIFLTYFQERGHTVVKSSPLVPEDDPSLLFTNAGMVQFKQAFMGNEIRPYKRAASSQKCVRAGGKHNDLENVGVTSRHHTFFEMLGNFSFGDYFKETAIVYAWDLLTNVMRLSPDRLWVSVHVNDDEAHRLWTDKIGISANRIVRLGDEDNFWAMGDTGPCGPCSEIIFDQGTSVGCGQPECNVECDCDRFLEIWNLVFMQYNRSADGTLTSLPKPSIDTGMGLERITAVLQGVTSNYATDLFLPILSFTSALSGQPYGQDPDLDTSIRVIADHTRASAFLVCDGVLPSNEGRGYVLRRIIRRASRHGKLLGIAGAFLHRVAQQVIEEMGGTYPELRSRHDFIARVIANEEERFLVTLDKGLALLADAMFGMCPGEMIPGDAVFKLYDTFGFPVDLTEDIARKSGLIIDKVGFEEQMELQREKARAGSMFINVSDVIVTSDISNIKLEVSSSEFVGYETLEAMGKVIALLSSDAKKTIDSISQGNEGLVITNRTPFYGETGGQVGDTGSIAFDGGKAQVVDTLKNEGVILHKVQVESGSLKPGMPVRLAVHDERRRDIMRHHSATHLLQRAIRDVLGSHAHQSGSFVDDKRLRFDFTHFAALSPEELQQIEDGVNHIVLADLTIATESMAKEKAMALGAMALFSEKYTDEVRVVTMGDGVSVELCGGTHCRSTGEIGCVKIISEASVSAGLRRIEAYAGRPALAHYRALSGMVASMADQMKCAPTEIVDRLAALQARIKEQENKIRELNIKIATGVSAASGEEVLDGPAGKVVIKRVETEDVSQMREVGDRIKERIRSGIVLLTSPGNDKLTLMIMTTQDSSRTWDAGKIMKQIMDGTGGRGGGKALFAQGGADNAMIDKAIAIFKQSTGV